MNPHPISVSVDHPQEYEPAQLLFRMAAFLLLGMLGLSFGLVFLVCYLALPLYVAMQLQGAGFARFRQDDAPRLERALAWFVATYSWMALLVDRLPSQAPSETVRLTIEGHSALQTASSAARRILSGLPSLVVLSLANVVGAFVWVYGAFTIVTQRRVGPGTYRFLFGLQRFAVRLLAYQSSLTDELPRFDFSEPPLQVRV